MFKWIMVLILLLFIYHVREVFPPFIVGGIFAYLWFPLVNILRQRFKMPPFFSVLAIYLVSGSLLAWLVVHGQPWFKHEFKSLLDKETMANYISKIVEQVNLISPWHLDKDETTDFTFNQLQSMFGSQGMHLVSEVFKSFISVLICTVTSIYLLVDYQRVGRFFLRFIPTEKRSTVVTLSAQMDVMFRKYVVGQLFLITFMSIVAFCILHGIFRLKYAIPIAVATGFLQIIPVLGPLCAILLATAFGMAQLGLSEAGGIALCYWIARLVEDYIVVPNTIGHAVELHPLAVIFAVIVGENLAGALGMLIAIPVAAAIKVVIDFAYPPQSQAVAHHHKSPAESIKQFLADFKPINYDEELKENSLAYKATEDASTIEAMHEGMGTIAAEAAEQTAKPVTTAAAITEPKLFASSVAPDVVLKTESKTVPTADVAKSDNAKPEASITHDQIPFEGKLAGAPKKDKADAKPVDAADSQAKAEPAEKSAPAEKLAPAEKTAKSAEKLAAADKPSRPAAAVSPSNTDKSVDVDKKPEPTAGNDKKAKANSESDSTTKQAKPNDRSKK